MESLQLITIKTILDHSYFDMNDLKSIKQKINELMTQKEKMHWEDFFSEEINYKEMVQNSSVKCSRDNSFMIEESDIRYMINSTIQTCPLLIRDINLRKYWRFNGRYDDYIVEEHQYGINNTNSSPPSENILKYGLYLWKVISTKRIIIP